MLFQHGVIDEKFYIDGLPLSQIEDVNIVKSYMHLISKDIVPRMKDMTNKVQNNCNRESSFVKGIKFLISVLKFEFSLVSKFSY